MDAVWGLLSVEIVTGMAGRTLRDSRQWLKGSAGFVVALADHGSYCWKAISLLSLPCTHPELFCPRILMGN